MIAVALLGGCRPGVPERVRDLYVLGKDPSDAEKGRIRAALRDPDRDVRAAALVVMEGTDSTAAREMAIVALDDPDGWVRAAAVRVLGAHTDAQFAARLAQLGPDDPVPQVRAAVLDAISGFDGEEIRETIVRGLDDSIRHVRRAALRAGVTHPGVLPTPRLADIVANDLDWENRVAAARVLGASGDPAAYAPLDGARADPNEFVRAAATREVQTLARAGIQRPGV